MGAEPLRSSSYAILLLISLRGPSSPYDLKRALDRLALQFWAVPHTQLYDETARLATDGYLTVRREMAGRRRQTYRLSARGRRALDAWLRTSDAAGMAIRDEAQLKLMATELIDADAVRALAVAQVAHYRERMDLLEHIAASAAEHPEWALRYLALPLGRAIYRAALEFWEGVAADPPG
jgi:DNA-binding PadR family transcriptional regulator